MMKFAMLVAALLALIVAASSRDTGLAGLCYVNGVDKFLPLSHCLRWVRDNGHHMLWEGDKEQGMTVEDIENNVDELYPVAEEVMLNEEWNL